MGIREPREPMKHLEHQKEKLGTADREEGLLSPSFSSSLLLVSVTSGGGSGDDYLG